MKVKPGDTYHVNKSVVRKDFKQMHQLREKMIRKKYRNLYKSMKRASLGRQKEIKLLKYKRRLQERKAAQEKYAAKQAQRMAAMI